MRISIRQETHDRGLQENSVPQPPSFRLRAPAAKDPDFPDPPDTSTLEMSEVERAGPGDFAGCEGIMRI
jgi:hypothetical protein